MLGVWSLEYYEKKKWFMTSSNELVEISDLNRCLGLGILCVL